MAEGKNNLNIINLIKKMHDVFDEDDVEKQRQNQEHVASILRPGKDIEISPFSLAHMDCEWVKPSEVHRKRPVILYCHGGGYTSGSIEYAKSITLKLAKICMMDIMAFNYRLAPENVYPAASDDALEAWNHLMYLGYAARDVIVMGDSAGGNLALNLVLRLINEKRMLPKGVVLLSPWTDMTCTNEAYIKYKEKDPILTPEYIYKSRDSYLAEHDSHDYMVSPIYADLKDFPPTYIQVGTNEILLGDSIELYKAMKKAGVKVNLEKFNGMWHVFQMSPFANSVKATKKIAEFIFELYG